MPHRPLAVTFANGTTTTSISSGTLPACPVTAPVSIMTPSSLTHQLLGVAPFTNIGCEAHFDMTSAHITKMVKQSLLALKPPPTLFGQLILINSTYKVTQT